MKLIYCNNCRFLFTPTADISKCNCGETSGRILEGVTYFSGVHAEPIFLSDTVVSEMIACYPDTGAVIESYENAKKNIKDQDRDFCTKVLEYLNDKAGTSFSTKYPSSNTQLIISRRDEHKCTLEDFYRVIDNKSLFWIGTSFELYMRPKTLFNKTNFANYLGEKNARKQQPATKSSITGLVDSANEAKRDIIGGGTAAK